MSKLTVQGRNTVRYCIVFLSLLILFFIAVIWSIKSGSVDISVKDILRIVFLRDGTDNVAFNVIWKIRLPRILLSVLLRLRVLWSSS